MRKKGAKAEQRAAAAERHAVRLSAELKHSRQEVAELRATSQALEVQALDAAEEAVRLREAFAEERRVVQALKEQYQDQKLCNICGRGLRLAA